MNDEPRIWMDITTTRRFGGRVNGTTRVEQSLARELRLTLGDRLSFCALSASGFAPAASLPAMPAAGAGSARTLGASHARSNRLGRRLERVVRHAVKSGWKRLSSQTSRDPFPAAASGDCLFLAGETWSPRYDFATLASLRQRRIKIVALCQDLIPVTHPQFFESDDFVARFRRYIDYLLYETDLIVAISQSTARELEKLRDVSKPSARIAMIQLGSDFNTQTPSQPPRGAANLAQRGFALSVSTIQSRKNFDLLYRVWRRLAAERPGNHPLLVIAGQRGFGSDDLLRQIAHDPLTKDSIVVLHDATDAVLAWLYDHCGFTLYPSFAEGWGLPISESLHRGKACIASDATSMPEAAQGLCVLRDPIDTMGWYRAVVAWLDDPRAIADAEATIAAKYQPRSWTQTAQEIAAALRNVTAP